jgi:hypothetical protein
LKHAIDAVFDALRSKGAIGAMFDTQGLRRAAAHEKLPSEIGYADFGPLDAVDERRVPGRQDGPSRDRARVEGAAR